MTTRPGEWLLFLVASAAALLSAYGWWFHFSAGPAHGAGREVGIVAGAVSAVSLGLGWRLMMRRRQ